MAVANLLVRNCRYRTLSANESPGVRWRHRQSVGFTLVEVIIVILVVLVLIVLGIVVVRHQRAKARLARCSENLVQIGRDASGSISGSVSFPHAPAEFDEVGRVRYAPGMIGVKRGDGVDANTGLAGPQDTELSTTRSLWLLRREGTPARVFVCPSSADKPNGDSNPKLYWDFRAYSEVSYGIRVPFGRHGQPTFDAAAGTTFAADKGPYGAALEASTRDPGTPTVGGSAADEAWSPWNSPNHGGTGQNVLFVDLHVAFLKTPICGSILDNIYTRWSSATADIDHDERSRIQGTPPTGIETPWSDMDSLIYP